MWFSDAGTIRTDHYLFYPCLKSFINFSLFNGSSRLRDLPPQTLTEPYVRLSPHTALHVPCKLPSLRKSLVLPISGWPKFYFGHVSPFAPFPLQKLHHYYELIRPCALHWYSRLVGFPLELLPYHQNDRFSCSVLKPALGLCPLYAGCRSARVPVIVGAYLWLRLETRFWQHHVHFDTSSRVHLRSSPQYAPDGL